MSHFRKYFKFKLGLALGGGGVRSFAHIGLLQVFTENKIPVDMVVGTSMGAIIGACFALGMSPEIIKKKLLSFCAQKEIMLLEKFTTDSEVDEKKLIFQKFVHVLKDLYLWNISGARKWLVNFEKITPLIEDLLGKKEFSDTKIPFACVTCDLNTGEEVILDKGKLLDAVLASCALPGIFPPMKIHGKLLVDGGILGAIHTWVLRDQKKVDFVLGVNVENAVYNQEFFSGIDVLFQSDFITTHKLNQEMLKLADFVIEPPVNEISWSSFSKGTYCIEKGKEATIKALPQLRAALTSKRLNPFS